MIPYLCMIVVTWFYEPALYVRDGRLTDLACYAIIAGAIILAVRLAVMEHAITTGERDEASLPWFLQDKS